MKLGIDFGSTYSTGSGYNRVDDRVEPLTLTEGEPASIPSVVSISRRGQITCGQAAKNQVGKSTVKIYEAFKMLLTEQNQAVLRSHGYDEQYTPRYITKCFLNNMLQGILNRYDDGRGLEKVCICVPEIWSKKLRTLDGRVILRDILQNDLDVPVGTVQVVNEPDAASAFFAYNYEKTTGKRFDGHLLLIDYGGGTLDITLTRVCPNQNGTMEIRQVDSDGEGENHPNARGEYTIGKAGIAYMQTLAIRAMRDCGALGKDETPAYTSPAFLSAVRDLENQLKTAERIKDIEDEFELYGSYRDLEEILQAEPEELLCLEYNGEEVPVTYQQLFAAYRETIEGVVSEKIGKINRSVKDYIQVDPCDPNSGMQDNFKIALVGGFGSFYLVRKQIAEIYKLDANERIDPRTQNIAADRRELAISLGAALLAEGKVVLQKTARYSIGLYTFSQDGVGKSRFAIRCHQPVKTDWIYFLLFDESKPDTPANRLAYSGLKKNIDTFVIEFPGYQGSVKMVLKQEMRERLARLPDIDLCDCGFSMDENEIVTFHAVPHQGMSGPKYAIPLERYAQMFEITEVTP
ncbi:MAG: Hsp70 family protein [Clostridiales bacterium]|nr:Hsp70 family protein [Clostridiales bacterium]